MPLRAACASAGSSGWKLLCFSPNELRLFPFLMQSKLQLFVLKIHSLCFTHLPAWSLLYFSSAKVFPSKWQLKFDFISSDLRTFLLAELDPNSLLVTVLFHTLPEASVP